MSTNISSLNHNIEAAIKRVQAVGKLRKMLELAPEHDISERQWQAIETKLKTSEARIVGNLKQNLGHAFVSSNGSRLHGINAQIVASDLESAKLFAFFDTYLDVLSQRHIPNLGRQLAGCDALAYDALHRNHPALAIVEPPLVYCDRGIGASTIREGVMMPGQSANPLPLIQIPYSRLLEKCNLTSIFHEVGHEAMVRLGLKALLPEVVKKALRQAGASDEVQNLYALWMSEIGPDFWAFCCSGLAAAGAVREVLAFPASMTFRVSWADPHPPAYLRALLNFRWCRDVWGNGIWDDWELDWRTCYPLADAPEAALNIIQETESYLPVVSQVLLQTKFRVLENRPISSLFELDTLHPAALKPVANAANIGKIDLKGLPPTAHLAVFRLVKESRAMSADALDNLMTRWLYQLKK